ncbi:oligosaccharide flippase family protein [Thalassotalea marina]|uniref:oligosaccharide flippase family protein n=1 Tax=Thalassotalea marina TaxID=1673741 RepID=UPI00167B37FB|nr:oligosaccharide flippase family protein [Thalassotalea marina]
MKLLFFINTSVKSSSLIFGFVISVVLSNFYGAATLGIYTLFITWLNLLLLFTRGGQDRVLLKELSEESSTAKAQGLALFDAVILSAVLSIIAGLFLLLFYDFGLINIPSTVSSTLFLACLTAVLLTRAVQTIVVTALRAKERVTLANFLESVPFNLLFLLVLLGIALSQLTQTTEQVLWWYLLVSTLVTLLSVSTLRQHFLYHAQCSIKSLVERFKHGLPFILIFGTTTLNTSIDSIMVNQFLPIEQLAYYNVALKLSSLVQFGLVIATSLVMAQFATLYRQGKVEQLNTLIIKTRLLALSLAVPVVLVLYLAGGYIMAVWGQEFIAANQATLILATAQLINVAFGPIGVMLTIVGKEKQVLYWSAVTLAINTLGNYVLVPIWGIEGAAISTAVAVVLENVLFYLIAKRQGILVSSSKAGRIS